MSGGRKAKASLPAWKAFDPMLVFSRKKACRSPSGAYINKVGAILVLQEEGMATGLGDVTWAGDIDRG